MNNTALGAENKKEQTINFISEAQRYAIRMCTTRHFAIALVSAMIQEEMLIASMILRRDV